MNYAMKVLLYENESRLFFDKVSYELIDKFIHMIFEAYDEERTIFACANGGRICLYSKFCS